MAKSKNSPDGMEEENRVFLEPFKDGLSGKYGLFDFIIEPKFKDARCFRDGLAAVKIDGKYGFINTKGEWVIEPKFDAAWEFSEGFAGVIIDGKWAFINTKGELVIEPKFDNAYRFSDGIARVKIDGKIGYINTKGEWVVEPYPKKKGKKDCKC